MRYLAFLATIFAVSTNAQAPSNRSDSLEHFAGFLARSSVTIRENLGNIDLQHPVYELVQGQQLGQSGCTQPGPSLDGWNGIGTRRAIEIAHDRTTCEYLYIWGILPPNTPKLDDQLMPSGESSDINSPNSGAVGAAVRSFSDCAATTVAYTDGNAVLPLIGQSIVQLTGFPGIAVATATARVGYSSPEPDSPAFCSLDVGSQIEGGSSGTAGGVPLPSLAWTEQYDVGDCPRGSLDEHPRLCIETCGSNDFNAKAVFDAKYSNNGYIPGIFDCREGASIIFDKFGVRSSGQLGGIAQRWQISNEARIFGPLEMCTENLFRQEDTAFDCATPD